MYIIKARKSVKKSAFPDAILLDQFSTFFQRNISIQERRRKLKKARTEEEEIAHRIATEERMLLVAQRKLESIRVLDDVLERVKVIVVPLPTFRTLQQPCCCCC